MEEMLAENFPNMGKEILNQVQKAQRLPGRINPRRNTPRYMVIKLIINDKDKILKAAKEKMTNSTQGNSHQAIYQLISQQKLYKPEGNGTIYLK